MSGPSHQQIARMLQGMIVERQRLLIREANYLWALVGLPPVKPVSEDPPLHDVARNASDVRPPSRHRRSGGSSAHDG